MHRTQIAMVAVLLLALAACQSTSKGGIEDNCTPDASDAGLCQGGVQVDS